MKVKFIGDANGHAPNTITLFGFTWNFGETIDVPDDHRYSDKLRGNSHFECDGEDVIEGEAEEVIEADPAEEVIEAD